MPYLEVPQAVLYYETVGEGPLFLCISGADGSCEIWRRFADFLKAHFKVVMWDRRGFSRSYLTGPQDYTHRLETDVDDAALLIQHLSPTPTSPQATVLGNSSGAIIALVLLTRHPSLLRTLISYEPPAATLLPDFPTLWSIHEKTHQTYLSHGPHSALKDFSALVMTEDIMASLTLDPTKSPHAWSNLQYWFEREFMHYPKREFDVEGDMWRERGKLVCVIGEESPRAAYQVRGNEVLTERLGLRVVVLPGGHVGQVTHAEAFSNGVLEVLRGRGEV